MLSVLRLYSIQHEGEKIKEEEGKSADGEREEDGRAEKAADKVRREMKAEYQFLPLHSLFQKD